MQKQDEKRTVPGVWSALSTGFDLTAKHPWLLLIPIMVDIFVWLGPRLRFGTIIDQIVANLPQETELLTLANQLLEIGPQTNLFTVLSVPLLGVPVLFAGLAPQAVPLAATSLDIRGTGEWLAVFVLLSLTGLFLTAVYYVAIASVVGRRHGENSQLTGSWLGRSGKSWLRLIGLAFVFMIIALAIYVPISLVGALLFMLSSAIGTLVLLLAPLVVIWVVIYLSFSPPAITLNDRPLIKSIKESVLLVQTNLAAVLAMVLIILFVGTLLDWVLLLADNGNWLTVFNILIHAFVSTAFITAFFILYQDRANALAERDSTYITSSL